MAKFCSECGSAMVNDVCPKCGYKNSINGIIDRKKIKKTAKEFLSKDFGKLLLPSLIVTVISAVLSLILSIFVPEDNYFYELLSLISSLILVPMSVGVCEYYLSYIRGKEFKLGDIFNFYDNRIWKVWGATILCYIFTTLWTFLFIIPGIIAIISYSQYMYILVDKSDEYNANMFIKKSKLMMNGYKSDYFTFVFSFIGWYLLSLVTFGIALIYVIPYLQVSEALYYEELKKIKEN